MLLRRREKAKSELRRRNIFELYIEEVVEACGRLKGGKLAKEKLKSQLQKIAQKRTGGSKTDQILGQDSGPEGLPHSIIVTPEGTEGEAPELPGAAAAEAAPVEVLEAEKARTKKVKKARAKATKGRAAKRKTKAARGKRK
jgi:DNA topoisomerase-6 subunit B